MAEPDKNSKLPQNGQTLPSFQEFDLESRIAQLRQEQAYQRGRTSKVLFKYPGFSVVLFVLMAGTLIPEHSTPSRITVQTLKGRIRMHAGASCFDLPEGRLLTLDHDIPHDVKAIEESAFLLTLAAPA